jgi:radical SAM protein with 4Fe4S-binding SPASM domain
MDWATIERIIYNLRDLNYRGRISWFWINEPLMDRRMLDILKLSKKHCPRAFHTLTTNGDLLNKAKYLELRKSGLDAMAVSIYDDKAHAKVKPLEDSRLVLHDKRDPKHLENRAGSIKQNGDMFENEERQQVNRSCERPFKMMTINPKGEVSLCCSDMYTDVLMGNVNEQRLEEIWHNEKFEHYRRTLSEKGRKGLMLCDGCSYRGKANGPFAPFHHRPKSDYFKYAVNTIRHVLRLDRFSA